MCCFVETQVGGSVSSFVFYVRLLITTAAAATEWLLAFFIWTDDDNT